jgi:hypothetical protein
MAETMFHLYEMISHVSTIFPLVFNSQDVFAWNYTLLFFLKKKKPYISISTLIIKQSYTIYYMGNPGEHLEIKKIAYRMKNKPFTITN